MNTSSEKPPTSSDGNAPRQAGQIQAENKAQGPQTTSENSDVERVIQAFVQALQVVKPAK
jgi:hypothetical protein